MLLTVDKKDFPLLDEEKVHQENNKSKSAHIANVFVIKWRSSIQWCFLWLKIMYYLRH